MKRILSLVIAVAALSALVAASVLAAPAAKPRKSVAATAKLISVLKDGGETHGLKAKARKATKSTRRNLSSSHDTITICIGGGLAEWTFPADPEILEILEIFFEDGGFYDPANDFLFFEHPGEGYPNPVVPVTVTEGPCPAAPKPAPRGPDGIHLCYSKFQTVPGVWYGEAANKLMEAGYWKPGAVAGAMKGGNNTMNGEYHLDCNPGNKGLKPTGRYVDLSGTTLPPLPDIIKGKTVYEVWA